MANNQRSQFWDTASGVGDGNDTYSAAQWREMARALWTPDRAASEGVLAGVNGNLAVSGASSPLSVASGAALVNGIYYQNTSALGVAVPTPTNGTTRHRVVLRAAWGTTQACRAALISSADGVNAYPALTQQDNSQWEIPLAGVTITTGSAIALEDQRDYAHFAHALVYRRQGGSASGWSTVGTNAYRPGGARIQSGVAWVEWDDDEESDSTTVTFPQAYSQPPLVLVTPISAGVTHAAKCRAGIYEVTASTCKLRGYRTDEDEWSATIAVQWLAIGPR